jgi:hypothetical protein
MRKRHAAKLRRRYGRAKGHEVQRHKDALRAGLSLLDSQLGVMGDMEHEGRKLVRGVQKEHDWLLAHCEKKA